MAYEFLKDKWTCPNDRQLQLRAKLNSGWSYHTEQKMQTQMNKNSQLSESELIAIQKVLQRSEMLERLEQERVSKLVERLENLKRHAMQSTIASQSTNRCAICADYFCLLRSTPNSCNICQKLLCSKCCIDTLYSADDLSSRSSSSSGSSGSKSNQQIMWLCRICSEQRELWKKSGAWFLKKYPNYVAPNLKPCGSVTSTLSEPQNSSKNNSTLSSSTANNKDQLSHQVSFSLPSTPNKKKFIPNQSPPHKLWNRDDSSDYDDQPNNDTPNNETINIEQQQQQQQQQSSPMLSNVCIPNSINSFNISNYPTSTLNQSAFNINKISNPNGSSTTIIGNNNHSNSSSVSSSPNSPTSKYNSNASSPVSIVHSPDVNLATPKSTPSQKRSFRKPKLLEWCSNQFSFDTGSNSSLNEYRKKSISGSPQSTPAATPVLKAKLGANRHNSSYLNDNSTS